MKRLWAIPIVLLFLTQVVNGQDTYTLSFSGDPSQVAGQNATYTSRLQHDGPGPGAQAFSFGVQCSITGFDSTCEITLAEVNAELAAATSVFDMGFNPFFSIQVQPDTPANGAVVAVITGFSGGAAIMLGPDVGLVDFTVVTQPTSFPATLTLDFVDGIQGAGDPVPVTVTQDAVSFDPATESKSFTVESPDSYTYSFAGPESATGSFDQVVTLAHEGPGNGAQAFSFGMQAVMAGFGDAEISAVSLHDDLVALLGTADLGSGQFISVNDAGGGGWTVAIVTGFAGGAAVTLGDGATNVADVSVTANLIGQSSPVVLSFVDDLGSPAVPCVVSQGTASIAATKESKTVLAGLDDEYVLSFIGAVSATSPLTVTSRLQHTGSGPGAQAFSYGVSCDAAGFSDCDITGLTLHPDLTALIGSADLGSGFLSIADQGSCWSVAIVLGFIGSDSVVLPDDALLTDADVSVVLTADPSSITLSHSSCSGADLVVTQDGIAVTPRTSPKVVSVGLDDVYTLSFDGPATVEGAVPVQTALTSRLQHTGSGPGAQGFSFGVTCSAGGFSDCVITGAGVNAELTGILGAADINSAPFIQISNLGTGWGAAVSTGFTSMGAAVLLPDDVRLVDWNVEVDLAGNPSTLTMSYDGGLDPSFPNVAVEDGVAVGACDESKTVAVGVDDVYTLSFDGETSISGTIPLSTTCTARLQHTGSAAGAQAVSFGVECSVGGFGTCDISSAAVNANLTALLAGASVNPPFIDITPTTGAGNEGWTVAIITGFDAVGPVILPDDIQLVDFDLTVNPSGVPANFTLSYTSTLMSSGLPVPIVVSQDGLSVQPIAQDKSVTIGLDDAYALGFDVSNVSLTGAAGSTQTSQCTMTLAHSGSGPGAEGFSTSFQASGVAITGIAIAGDALGLVCAPEPMGAGNFIQGGISSDGSCAFLAAVLCFDGSNTLTPNATTTIGTVDLSAVIPSGSSSATLEYQDGCVADASEPVANTVSQQGGLSVVPALGSKTISLGEIPDCCGRGLNFHFSADRISDTHAPTADSPLLTSEGDFPEFDEGCLGHTLGTSVSYNGTVEPGGLGTLSANANVISEINEANGLALFPDAGDADKRDNGVQGFSLSVAFDNLDPADLNGDTVADGFETDNTAMELNPLWAGTGFGGGSGPGPTKPFPSLFISAEIIDPAANDGQKGMILAFVNCLDGCDAVVEYGEFPGLGTETMVRLAVTNASTLSGGSSEGGIRYQEGLRAQMASVPAESVLTVAGDSFSACNRDSVGYKFTFVEVVEQPFLRCDPNNDGKTDLADPIWIINDIFRDLVDTDCEESVDCNNDGNRGLDDVSYGINYLFLGGDAPPAPFGACGIEEGADCSSHSSCL